MDRLSFRKKPRLTQKSASVNFEGLSDSCVEPEEIGDEKI